ncbi:hypothetical protein P5705_00730 [Pseudomonas entomophila]|uniref:hypothetical protein n=1 Tax=Pseudomonas entomophila TaxID=312306 RepID=UPI00240591AD|nr:hypothetical protein [Pseudomonas entomophila]MDF9616158.1 hypothetical protein [Pseudomonas entomophila]
MAKQTINLGNAPDGAGGDTQRSAWVKAAGNFDELYQANANLQASKAGVGNNGDINTLSGLTTPLTLAQGGTGAKTAADARNALGLGSAATRSVGAAAGNLMEVGAFGVGNTSSPYTDSINRMEGGFSLMTPNTQYGVGATGISYGSILTVPYSSGEFRAGQLFFGQAPEARLVLRSGSFASAGFYVIYHSGNTTRAADGTLKAI